MNKCTQNTNLQPDISTAHAFLAIFEGESLKLDAGCIRWLVKQPGRKIEELAGPNQRVKAIVSLPTSDILENQVTRWVIKDLYHECERYLQQYREFATRCERYQSVENYQTDLRTYLANRELADVRPHTPPCIANNALRFEPRYQIVWETYEALVQKNKQLEQACQWPHVYWLETGRQLLGSAVQSSDSRLRSFLGENTPYFNTTFTPSGYLGPQIAPGPHEFGRYTIDWIEGSDATLTVEEVNLIEGLGVHQAALIDVPGQRRQKLLPFWFVWHLEESDNSIGEMLARSCLNALENAAPTTTWDLVGGQILLAPTSHSYTSRTIEKAGRFVRITECDPRNKNTLPQFLEDLHIDIELGALYGA